MGAENELTDDLIDIAVEDNLKKGIEEMQKYIMDTVNRGIKNQAEIQLRKLS
jgi:hypothetical protein